MGLTILTKKKRDEILKRVAACQIITNKYVEDNEAFSYMTEKLADIALEVGDIPGATKVKNTIDSYFK